MTIDDAQLKIRSARIEDAPGITCLSDELGYISNTIETQERLANILKSKDSAVYVAIVSESNIVGWVHIFRTERIESECFGEIGGLIVSKGYRNQGIGKKLILAAETWLKQHGIKRLRVRSNIKRNESHNFYSKLGFEKEKTQTVLDKMLE